MNKKIKVTASVVLYKNDLEQLKKLMESVEASGCVEKLFVIDNAACDVNKKFFADFSLVEYIPHKNSGYGAGHNVALKRSMERGAAYNVIINPDVFFGAEVIPELCKYMDENLDVACVMPKVLYPTGEIQYLCKLLPTPTDLIFRRFFPRCKRTLVKNDRYILKESGYDKIMNIPTLSGCFMFFRNDVLKQNNLFFDERFFMYLEDFDLIRRVHEFGKTIFYPGVSIVHTHTQASYRNPKMLLLHIRSAIQYFNKWGWIFDKQREDWNEATLKEVLGK